jgi:superfamily II DNA helicase RecQ
VVIYTGQPQKLRDYTQESGRAGRDGQSSEAIIVASRQVEGVQARQAKSWTKSKGEDIVDFVSGYSCRRVIIDQVMDGRIDRVGCEEGEEQCDVCLRLQEMDLAMVEWPVCNVQSVQSVQSIQAVQAVQSVQSVQSVQAGQAVQSVQSSQAIQAVQSVQSSQAVQSVQSSQAVQSVQSVQSSIKELPRLERQDEIETVFERQQQERQWLASKVTRQCREEGQEIAEFEEQLRKWANGCPLCKLQKRRQQQHRLEDCKHPELESVLHGVHSMTEEMQGKKRFDKFSCCFDCGVPQAICQKWKQKDRQGWFEKVAGVECQYKGVLIAVVVVIWQAWDSPKTNII